MTEEFDNAPKQTFTLKPQEELRFEVEFGKPDVALFLKQGKAEIFGAEISNMMYRFSGGTKLAVFTYHGCVLELAGNVANPYVASETPMNQYFEVAEQLDKEREQVNLQREDSLGPRVMICGPVDTGKSSMSKILLNYATRLKRSVLFADFDVGQGEISIPGTLSLAALTTPIDVEEGFNLISPLVFFYGHTSPDKNVSHYKSLVDHIATIVEQKGKQNPEFRKGGLIINTCGWIDGTGYDILLHIAQALNVNNIIVMGDDRLTNNLRRDLVTNKEQSTPQTQNIPSMTNPIPNINIVRLQKSGGVVGRNATFRKVARMSRIREYFSGAVTKLDYHSNILKFDDVQIYRIGSNIHAPASALPIGEQSAINPTQPKEMVPDEKLNAKILAVSNANQESEIVYKNVAGFVHVTRVDLEKREITVSAPAPGKLPKRFLIVGTLEWLEE